MLPVGANKDVLDVKWSATPEEHRAQDGMLVHGLYHGDL
jgi:hypothetical protein